MMKSLHRRTFLRGVGASIGLPFLDAMTPAFAAPKKPPCRLMIVYAPSGKIMRYWTPQTAGPDFEFTRTLKPLEKYRGDTLVLSGLADRNGEALGDGAGDHARAASSYLTGVHPKKTEGADIHCGISMDQVAAARLGRETRLPSLELTCEDSRQAGSCDSYSCVYQSISWKSETQSLPPEINPRAVFERLFGDAALSPEQRAVRKSILDLAGRDTQRLKQGLGATDRRKLDEYLTSIREIESRIQRLEKESTQLPPGAVQPVGIPTSFREHAGLMFDLSMLAFQTDATRVITFMLAREGGLRTYPEAGVPEAHHSVTHHRGDPELIEKVAKINAFHVEQFADFVGRMKGAADGDGSLLDHSLVLYGASLGEPNVHDHLNLPTVLVGRGNGRVNPGRHVRYKAGTPVTNLHVTLLDIAGVPVETLGDSNEPLSLT